MLDDHKSQAEDSGIKDVKTVRREGNAAAEILLIADEEKVDTIVIGSKSLKHRINYGKSSNINYVQPK
jgi:nucleotide-binding universal stress UspA family protein